MCRNNALVSITVARWSNADEQRERRQAALQHCRAAIAALYETHFDRVVRYIALRIGDRAEAEDLTSEVFVRALRSADRYQEKGVPLEAWIFKIAHNLVIDTLRRRGRRPSPIPLEVSPPVGWPEDADEELERTEAIRALHQALRHLTEAQRRVLALRFGAGMTSEQAAQVLGKSPGAIREMQSAAIKKLRRVFGKG